MPESQCPKRDGDGKKGQLLCCKRIFHQIKGNLAEIQPKNHRNVQKTHFLQKVPGVNGLNMIKVPSSQMYLFDFARGSELLLPLHTNKVKQSPLIEIDGRLYLKTE